LEKEFVNLNSRMMNVIPRIIVPRCISLRSVVSRLIVSLCVVAAFAALSITAQAQSTADVFRLDVAIPNIKAQIGDTVRVPIIVRSLSTTAAQTLIRQCSFVFRFNPTTGIITDSSIAAGIYLANNLAEVNIVRFINRRLRERDTLLTIPILVCLGDVETSELEIDPSRLGYTFQVFDAANTPYTITGTNGLLSVSDARWNGILRTVNANTGGQLSLTISPNPVQTDITFQLAIGTLQASPMLGLPALMLYTLAGRSLDNVDLTTPARAVLLGKQLRFTRPRTLRGTYICRFTYGPYSLARLVVFE
jgi:hypothetical protein